MNKKTTTTEEYDASGKLVKRTVVTEEGTYYPLHPQPYIYRPQPVTYPTWTINA